jgi:hypothetical protein
MKKFLFLLKKQLKRRKGLEHRHGHREKKERKKKKKKKFSRMISSRNNARRFLLPLMIVCEIGSE